MTIRIENNLRFLEFFEQKAVLFRQMFWIIIMFWIIVIIIVFELLSWHTASIENSDNNSKHLPEQYRFLLKKL